MKYTWIVIIICQFIVLSTKAQPHINFNKTVHNFGTILWNHPVTTEFQLVNTGNTPLVISNVTVSCACAITDWTKTPIAAGQSGSVKAVFDAKALGQFEKLIGIYSNATPEPFYLTIKGKVATEVFANENDFPVHIGDIALDKNNIEFADTYWGDVVESEIRLMNLSDKEFVPQLMHIPSFLKVEYEPAVIPKNGLGKIKLKLDSRFLRGLGLTQTSVYLSRYPGDKVREENEIVLSAILLPDLSSTQQNQINKPEIHLSDTIIDFGAFGKKEKLTHTLVITNTGSSTLEISKLQVFSPAISATLRKKYIPAGGNTKLKITLSKKDLAKQKSDPKLLIITNDPKNPKTIIELKATID